MEQTIEKISDSEVLITRTVVSEEVLNINDLVGQLNALNNAIADFNARKEILETQIADIKKKGCKTTAELEAEKQEEVKELKEQEDIIN